MKKHIDYITVLLFTACGIVIGTVEYIIGLTRISLIVCTSAAALLVFVALIGLLGKRYVAIRAGAYITASLIAWTTSFLIYGEPLAAFSRSLAEGFRSSTVMLKTIAATNDIPLILASISVILLGILAVFFGAIELFNMLFNTIDDDQGKRRRSRSNLFGDSDFMGKSAMDRLTDKSGVLLGQYKSTTGLPRLMVYPLEGAITTYAMPREGKTSLKIANFLMPFGRGHQGPIVDIDPRGESYFVCARKRRSFARKVILVDPFRLVAKMKEESARFPEDVYAPSTYSHCFNPLDLIRAGDQMVGDIDMLLNALLEPPKEESAGNAFHFYKSMRTLLRGIIAFVRFKEPPARRTLHRVYEYLTQPPKQLKAFGKYLQKDRKFLDELPFLAGGVIERVSDGEGGSNFTTYVNALSFLSYPQIRRNMSHSTFNPLEICDNKMDIFIVFPEQHVDDIKPWIMLWATMANMCVDIRPPKKDILTVVDEMGAIGRLQKLVASFNMAAGKGLHYWTITQTESTFDRTYGESTREVITDLAEVVQILGAPRENKDFAQKISDAIGFATFEQTSLNEGKSSRAGDPTIIASNSDITTQDGRQISLVKEAVMSPSQIMQLPHNEQLILASPHKGKKQAMHIEKFNYWEWPEVAKDADLNPYYLRKKYAALEEETAA